MCRIMLFLNLEKHVRAKNQRPCYVDAQILFVIDEICMFMYHVNEGVIAT